MNDTKRYRSPSAGGAGGRGSWDWKGVLAAVPGTAASLLPVGLCPACWPAWAGVLGSLGLGFLLEETWLLPLTAVALIIAVASLAWKARSRRGYGPFALGLPAVATILVAKFVLGITPLVYGGIALLLAASLWNAWPVGRPRGDDAAPCPACASASPLLAEETRKE